MAALWQQVFALDARCNAQRTPNNSHFSTFNSFQSLYFKCID